MYEGTWGASKRGLSGTNIPESHGKQKRSRTAQAQGCTGQSPTP